MATKKTTKRKFWEEWKDVMFEPTGFYKKLPKTTQFKEPSKFYLKIQAITLGILYAILFLVGIVIIFFMTLFGEASTILAASSLIIIIGAIILAFSFPILLLLSWGMLFVSAAITHILVLLFNGKQGYVETFKVHAYASAPNIFAFIPIVNYASMVYALVLQVIGIRERQKLSLGASIAVVAIPVAIIGVAYGFIWFTLGVLGSLA